ncbi:HNH endonuclease signature motif containing protein [Breznakia pachnodae]|uniref:LXG domain-containing protein n=1 Tax=Breznakia pachnodae TaxID=265178 RepID=A0ABU0E6I9_9FIRM|nr:HNH endonuclease signature motif containing protein [Breznakia pachnodae]MDQ0362517.1 hypothetical protein [Breznakia pachnodae]
MSINMYLDEVQTQTQYANKLAVAYRNYAGKIDDVIQAYYNSELSGKAYDSNKEYFLSVYTPLSRGLKLVSNSLMNAHYMFPLMYESDVYTGNIEEHKLEEQIRQCKNYIYLLDSIQQGLPYMDWYLEQNIEAMERLLRALTQRLASFRAFNHESPRIFDDVLSLIDKVEVGLTLVESGKGYDELTQSFNIKGLDLSWANEINKIADERKYRTTMREQELELQGQVFKEGFEKKQYVSVDIYGQQKMMWLDNPPYISQEDIQFNDKYELWLNEMADLYGKEVIFGESKDIDYLSQMAWEAREGIDYYSGIKLTDTEILQRKSALLSYGVNTGIGIYWSTYKERMIKKEQGNFVYKLGKDKTAVELKGVKTQEITLTKTDDKTYIQLQKDYNGIRNQFIKDFANTYSSDLSSMGFTDKDIYRMQNGYVPEGYQVHHIIPLKLGGTNDYSNLVLIKNDPYHKTITAYQNSLTQCLDPGMSITLDWPVLKGNYYYNGGR